MQDYFRRENRETYSYIACNNENIKKNFEFKFYNNGKIEIQKKPANIKIKETREGFKKIYYRKKNFQVEILGKRQNNYIVLVNGNSYNFSVETKTSYKRKKALKEFLAENTKHAIIAPMPGKIIDVLVDENSEVKKGESLLILEAMKMQNEIMSHVNGNIKKVDVNVNDTVNKGDVLLWLE